MDGDSSSELEEEDDVKGAVLPVNFIGLGLGGLAPEAILAVCFGLRPTDTHIPNATGLSASAFLLYPWWQASLASSHSTNEPCLDLPYI